MRAPDGTGYEIDGPTDAPVVALIHGLGLCRHLWDPHVPLLSGRYRVLTYDLHGHGDSAPLPARASLGTYAEQLIGLMDHLEIAQAAVVGFSIGGMINRRLTLDHPGRLWALVILNSPHDRGEEAQRQVEERARAVRDQGALATMEAALARWLTPEFRDANPEFLQRLRDWRVRADPESYAQAAWILANGVRELTSPSGAISVPTLVMTGEHDSGSTPAMARAIAAGIAGAEVQIVPRLQHLGLSERPAAFAGPIVDFLGANRPR